ncbi:hypothetical protein THZG08_10088 [Vibrio owensii]|nr:hypothetical protein THZG08_10088 [Vibrio owensii]CAH1548471.1 hypothetical protein THOA03_10088 [Vibrio owensii]CAH1593607.1 hypothetical protein THZB04_70127 [Vibrio owensii]
MKLRQQNPHNVLKINLHLGVEMVTKHDRVHTLMVTSIIN